MRNSLLPIILLVLTVGASMWLIRGGSARGAGGPAVYPGILKLPTKTNLMTGSAALAATESVTGAVPAGAADWRVIQLSAEENRPLTNAVLLALGEELTRRGAIVIMDPVSTTASEPLPLGADAHLRISTTASEVPTGAPGALTFTTTIDAIPVRIPAAHPAARWFPDLPLSVAERIQIAHHSTPRQEAAWPGWFAAVGRSVGDRLLAHLAIPAAIADTTEAIRATAWVVPGQAETTSIFGRIPSPPQADVVQHLVAFQQPFVRGWIGQLSPVPITTRDGATRTSREELIRRLERGGWTAGPTVSELTTYSKDDHATDGTLIHRSLTILGAQLIEWQERPKPVALWEAWRDAAQHGDASAAAQLRRHGHTVGIPAELRSAGQP